MRAGEKLPDDQAEVVFADHCIEWLDRNLNGNDRDTVLDDIIDLCRNPYGKHPLSNRQNSRLAGFNTVESVERKLRIVYRTGAEDEVGLIEVIAIGYRRNNAVYDVASALVETGRLTEAESTQIWDALNLLDSVRERLGLESWDYAEKPAPEGLQKAAVASGLLDSETASLLSTDEVNAAMAAGWSDSGPDPAAALDAALGRVATSTTPERVLRFRQDDRCGATMPIAGTPCIRRAGHPGAHRSRR